MSVYEEMYTVERKLTDTIMIIRHTPGYAIVIKFLHEKQGDTYTLDELAGYGRYYGCNLANSRWRELIWLNNKDGFNRMGNIKTPDNIPENERYNYKTKKLAEEGFYVSHPLRYYHENMSLSLWIAIPTYQDFKDYMVAYIKHGKKMIERRNDFLALCT